MISLQTVISVFRDDPRFYNPITYLLCAPLLLVWAITTLRRRFSQESAWLALAAIAALSMLPLYHRLHDTGLLLLVFPAFAMLWARGGVTAWLALLFTGAGAFMTSDIPVQQLAIHSAHLRESTSGLRGPASHAGLGPAGPAYPARYRRLLSLGLCAAHFRLSRIRGA